MRIAIALLTLLGAAAAAQADQPAATPAAAPSSAVPAAAATSAAASSAADSAAKPSVTVQGTPVEDPLEKHFLSEGYKMEMRNGEKVFCRREEQIGTRLGGAKVCGTVQELNLREREAQQVVNKSMMQQNNPSGK